MSLTIETSGFLSPDDSAIETLSEGTSTPSRLEELHRFREHFMESMPTTRDPKMYDYVNVLLLSFNTTADMGGMENMDVSSEVKQLEAVFRDDYNFDVKNKVITCNKRSHLQAGLYLHEFGLESEGKEHPLSIVYYAGHGWRSRDFKRKGVAGFDLTASRPERETVLPEGTFILWEKAEQALAEFHNDVLVIFDCCDAGFLSNRGTAHAFEYLAACGDKSKTKGPGSESFTSALIWALKELKTEAPFPTQTLKDKIKTYSQLPTRQEPLVFNRQENMAGPICIAPLGMGSYPQRRRSSTVASGPREEECFYVDLRLFFTKVLSAHDGKHVARMISPAVQNKSLPLNAAHVSILTQGRIDTARTRWSRARHSICFLQRLNKRPTEYDEDSQRLNKRPTEYDEDSDDDNIVPPSRKRVKARRVEGTSRPSQMPIVASASVKPTTPVSDQHSSDTDTQIGFPTIRVAPSGTSSIDVHVPVFVTYRHSSEDQAS